MPTAADRQCSCVTTGRLEYTGAKMVFGKGTATKRHSWFSNARPSFVERAEKSIDTSFPASQVPILPSDWPLLFQCASSCSQFQPISFRRSSYLSA